MKKFLMFVASLLFASNAIAKAMPEFDHIDSNRDGILDKNEVAGIISDHEFNKADQNNDGLLSKNEYTEIVILEKRRTGEL
jgi:Ca2+-binding EF-hand superfamily protein